jgi:amphi-Trp domain-containing protein
MKYQESSNGQRSDFAGFIKKIVPDLFGGRLAVEGKTVTLPTDCDLEYKVKYDDGENGGAFTIKVSWDYDSDSDEEVEVETE